MLSKWNPRAVFITLAVLSLLTVAACRSSSPDASLALETEDHLSSVLGDLLPEGRIISNNLAAAAPMEVRWAYLFDKELVVEDVAGHLTSLERGNLAAMWYFTGLPGPTDKMPVVSPVSVVCVSRGVLFEVNREIGTQISAHRLHFVPSASPSASDSTAYFPLLATETGNRTITTVNLATGVEGWGLSTKGSVSTPPVMAGTTARPVFIFTTEAGGIFAMPAATSSEGRPSAAWTHGAHGRISAPVVIADDLVLVGSEQGELWALDRITGIEHWVHWSGKPILTPAWYSGDHVYFTNQAGFHALNRADGNELWSIKPHAQFLVRRPEAVYVEVAPGVVEALDPKTGETLRTATFPEGTVLVPNTADGTFFLVTENGLAMAVLLPL